ncbi:KpsF/GutQ family sugar-phosphate isomerase [Motiliproteus sp.]|uniref:KpsF/GutQ family sugar-phosphate isomerase n=1 Tax=Motiliproteus sp. TaxID=1898955 RepID=UPI003BAB0CC9
MTNSHYVAAARRVFELESRAVAQLSDKLDGDFDQAVELISQTEGKTVVCGMGKSGLIGQKISATLSSTGTASFFMHPGEAIHGDLGRVSPSDIFIAISYSGETEEVIQLLPFLLDNGNQIIAITGAPDSTLAQNATVHLDVSVTEEACPLNLAPTSSTTATLAMGDALAVALMDSHDFRPEQFARFHPGGSLGKKLLTRVEQVVRQEPLPLVQRTDTMEQIISAITQGHVGLVIVGGPSQVEGVISDGDIRRAMQHYPQRFLELRAEEIMSANPKRIDADAKVQQAVELMNDNNITALLVEKQGKICGIAQLFDCNL